MEADYDKAKKEATNLLEKFHLKEPPIDPEYIAEEMGVDVVFAQFKPNVSEKVSGFIEMNNKNARILINSNISTELKNFTIAHELGHFMLHKSYVQGDDYVIYPSSNNHDIEKSIEEQEADVFATELIAPISFLKKYQRIASLPELSKIFIASEDMLKRRLKNIE